MNHELRVSYETRDVDVEQVSQWLSEIAYWSLGRSRETIEKSIAHSLNISILNQENKFIGYGRVVTDYATFGWLCDVFVDPNQRGRGAGKAIARAATEYFRDIPKFRLILKTTDAHHIYRSVGFEEFTDPDKWMIINF